MIKEKTYGNSIIILINIIYALVSFRSSTFRSEEAPVSMRYAQGSWEGTLASDMFWFAATNSNAVTQQPHARVQFACILRSEEFYLEGATWAGIVGLGYEALSVYLCLCPAHYKACAGLE